MFEQIAKDRRFKENSWQRQESGTQTNQDKLQRLYRQATGTPNFARHQNLKIDAEKTNTTWHCDLWIDNGWTYGFFKGACRHERKIVQRGRHTCKVLCLVSLWRLAARTRWQQLHKYQPPLAEGANVRQNSLMTDHIDMLATACSKTLQRLRLQIVTI